MDFSTILELYYSHLKSTRTVKEYSYIINLFETFTTKNFLDCNQEDALSFSKHMAGLAAAGEISRKTYYSRISVLNSISSYIENNNLIPDYHNIFKRIIVLIDNEHVTVSDLPDFHDLSCILEAAKSNLRDFTIFSLCIKCGLSCSQLCSLNEESLLYDNENKLSGLRIISGRNYNDILLPDDICAILTSYLSEFAIDNDSLFKNSHGKPLKIRTLQRILQKYVVECKGRLNRSNITFQQLRHAAIFYMKHGGASDEDIAKYTDLSVRTILRYNKISEGLPDAATNSVLSINYQ